MARVLVTAEVRASGLPRPQRTDWTMARSAKFCQGYAHNLFRFLADTLILTTAHRQHREDAQGSQAEVRHCRWP